MYQVKDLDWDTRLFEIKMGELKLDQEPGRFCFSETAWRKSFELAKRQNYHFLLCQVDTKYHDAATFIMDAGGIIGDTLLTLELTPLSPVNTANASQFQLDLAAEEDLPEIIAIAKKSFEYSRFFQDAHFDKAKTALFYPRWILESFGRNEKYYVLKEHHRVVGFISLQETPELQTLIIRLIAISETERGRGLGQALIQWTKNYALAHNCGRLQVGTQINNYPAVRLYEKNGFRLQRGSYRFHIWLNDALTAKIGIRY